MTDTIRDLLISLASHMAYMQGQLGARHGLDDPEDFYWYRESVLLRQKVTDALTDEPAVPEGREPASVTGQPSDEELTRLWFETDGRAVLGAKEYARAVLARWGNPAPQPPAEGEVAEVAAWLRAYRDEEFGPLSDDPDARWITRAAGLLEREGWALHRLHRLQQENARFREPERTILCDILANGTLLPDPDGKRYGVQPVDGEVAELVAWLRSNALTVKKASGNPANGARQRMNRAADLLQDLSPPQLVPVSERLPGQEVEG